MQVPFQHTAYVVVICVPRRATDPDIQVVLEPIAPVLDTLVIPQPGNQIHRWKWCNYAALCWTFLLCDAHRKTMKPSFESSWSAGVAFRHARQWRAECAWSRRGDGNLQLVAWLPAWVHVLRHIFLFVSWLLFPAIWYSESELSPPLRMIWLMTLSHWRWPSENASDILSAIC